MGDKEIFSYFIGWCFGVSVGGLYVTIGAYEGALAVNEGNILWYAFFLGAFLIASLGMAIAIWEEE